MRSKSQRTHGIGFLFASPDRARMAVFCGRIGPDHPGAIRVGGRMGRITPLGVIRPIRVPDRAEWGRYRVRVF